MNMTEFKQISHRLKAIASFIKPQTVIADIGSDHAYLPSFVCLQDETSKAIAGEVSPGPFESAKKTVNMYNLQDRIDVRLGSGLSVLTEEDNVSTVVIAGMGGGLIASILTDGKSILPRVERLILQPNTNGYIVRKALIENCIMLTAETLVDENEHIYEIIVADRLTKEPSPLTEQELLFGPFLKEEKSDIFKKKWQAEYDKLNYVMEQLKKSKTDTSEELQRYERKANWMEEILS